MVQRKILNLEDVRQKRSADGCLLRELLKPEDGAIRYSLAHAVLKPGETSKKHVLKRSEVCVIINKSWVTIDGKPNKIKAGDIICIPPEAEQYAENTSSEDLVFYCIVDPAWKEDDKTIL